jgi:hypothetical protein
MMTTYSDWQQHQLDATEPKREPATPTQAFDAWLRNEFAEKARDAVAELIDAGWDPTDAHDHVRQLIEDGEL